MLAIAILSLIMIFIKLMDKSKKHNPGMITVTISVIAWWDICFPLAVVILVVGGFVSTAIFLTEID